MGKKMGNLMGLEDLFKTVDKYIIEAYDKNWFLYVIAGAVILFFGFILYVIMLMFG